MFTEKKSAQRLSEKWTSIKLQQGKDIDVNPKIRGKTPKNHPFVLIGVWNHSFHPSILGFFPYFWVDIHIDGQGRSTSPIPRLGRGKFLSAMLGEFSSLTKLTTIWGDQTAVNFSLEIAQEYDNDFPFQIG